MNRGRAVYAAAALLLACLTAALAWQPPAARKIVVGSKSFTESVILGEIVMLLARHHGATATHRAELGGTQILFQALEKGDIDAYCEYTGTLLVDVLADENIRSEQDLQAALADRGLAMSGRLGFNNTYALGLKEEAAQRLGVATISDLARPEHAELRLGFSEEFMSRGDGWPGLKRRYHLPHEPRALDHSLAYRGLESGVLDVTDLYSTDAEIRFYNLRLLADDKAYFPLYHCVVLYRQDLIRESPPFDKVVAALAGKLDNAEMVELNARVKLDHVPEGEVAADFLRQRLGVAVAIPRDRWWDDLLRNTREHLVLVLASLAAAVACAVPLGVAASRRPRLGQAILGAVGILQTLPSMAVLVFMVPLLGLGPRPAIVALFLYSLLPIVRNTYAGLTGIAPSLRESAEVLGLPAWARLWRVELPLASPAILAGIKTAAVINVGTATIGALIGAGGYGQPILTGIRLADTGLILQGAVPAALLALAVQGGFELLERQVTPRGLRLK